MPTRNGPCAPPLTSWALCCVVEPAGGNPTTPTPSAVMQHHRVAPVSLQWHNLGCSYVINGIPTPVLQVRVRAMPSPGTASSASAVA
jgi:hypothetical protein